MRWFARRPTPTASTLLGAAIVPATPAYTGTQPLHGDWDIRRIILHPGGTTDRPKFYGWGIRLATNVPTTTDEWNAQERIWHGDQSGDYLGDGFVTPGKQPLTVEGPFRIEPRGRRLVVRFTHDQAASQTMAITFVLHQL